MTPKQIKNIMTKQVIKTCFQINNIIYLTILKVDIKK